MKTDLNIGHELEKISEQRKLQSKAQTMRWLIVLCLSHLLSFIFFHQDSEDQRRDLPPSPPGLVRMVLPLSLRVPIEELGKKTHSLMLISGDIIIDQATILRLETYASTDSPHARYLVDFPREDLKKIIHRTDAVFTVIPFTKKTNPPKRKTPYEV